MPDPGIQPPYLDPSQYPAYLDLQRKQQLTQALMGAAQQSASTPSDWNSMRVVPRRSPLSNVASLVTALMAGKSMHDLPAAQAKYFQGLMGGGPSQAAPAAGAPTADAAPAAPTGPEPPPMIRNYQDQPAQPSAIAAQQAPQSSPQQNSMLLTGEPRSSQMLMTMMGPQEYAKALAGRYAPTDMEKMLHAAGIDPASPEGQQALKANITKQNYIAPAMVRANSVALDAAGKPEFFNPSVPQGSMPQFGANGMPTAITPIPGGNAAIEAEDKAATLGKTEGQYNVLPTAGGGTAVVGGPGMGGGASGPPGSLTAPRVGGPGRPAQPLPGAWGSMPRLPVSGAIGGPDEFTKGRLQEAGKKDAELSSKYGTEADLADQKLQYNVESLKALPAAETGPLSEWMTENRAKLLELGVSPSLVPGEGSVTPTMELNKNLKQSALQGARAIFGSRMTQMEVRLQHEELSPSASMTRDAIQSLMQQDTIKQQYAKQRSQDYGKYVQNGGDPLRFESWYAKTFPLTTFAAKAVTPAAAVQRIQQNPALLPDFKTKYGWDPSE